MILAEDIKDLGDRKPDFMVLTGDGLWELRVLRGLVRKFPCNLVLFFPKSPLMRRTGKSVYEAIPVNVDKYKVCKFLILYDNEHHRNFNEDLTILNNVGIRVLFHEQVVPDRILYVFGKRGSRGVVIYTSVQGFRRSGSRKGINEEIVELIRLKFGVNISDDHRAIRLFLDSRDMDITELVESSGVSYLKQAFTLYLVLEELNKFESIY